MNNKTAQFSTGFKSRCSFIIIYSQSKWTMRWNICGKLEKKVAEFRRHHRSTARVVLIIWIIISELVAVFLTFIQFRECKQIPNAKRYAAHWNGHIAINYRVKIIIPINFHCIKQIVCFYVSVCDTHRCNTICSDVGENKRNKIKRKAI